MSQEADYVKVLFEVEDSDGSVEVETVWAIVEANGYRIDNIPFYAYSIAWMDVVSAFPDEGGMLCFCELVEPSGHSTVRLWFADAADVGDACQVLRQMGCSMELCKSRLVAVDIPPNVPYSWVRQYLERQAAAGVFEYEEACLAQGSTVD